MKKTIGVLIKSILFFSPSLLFFGYIFLQNYAPFGLKHIYSLKSQFNQIILSRHITELNPEVIITNDRNTLTLTAPTYLKLTNIPLIDERTHLSFDLSAQEKSAIEYTLFRTDRYGDPHRREFLKWYPATFPGYETLYEFDSYSILKTTEATNLQSTFTSDIEPDEAISSGIPTGSSIGMYPHLAINIGSFTNPASSTIQSVTILPWTVRGSLSLYTYIPQEELSLSFVKEDLNKYEGHDTYDVTVFDVLGNEVYSQRIQDDGIIDESYLRNPQPTTLTIPLPQAGTYFITFNNSLTEGTRLVTYDSIIHSMSLTANSVVSDTNEILFSEQTEFYVHTRNQSFEFTDSAGSRSFISLSNPISPNPEQLFIEQAPDGNIHLRASAGTKIRGLNISPTQEAYFVPFKYIFTQVKPDYWIIPRGSLITQSLLGQYAKKNQVGIGLRGVAENGSIDKIKDLESFSLTIQKDGLFQ